MPAKSKRLVRGHLAAGRRRESAARPTVERGTASECLVPRCATFDRRRRGTMPILLGDTAPDFTQESTEGPIHFYDWAGDSWVVLFSHPKDYTPVCTTELGAVARLKPEFDKRNTKVIGLSVDPVASH